MKKSMMLTAVAVAAMTATCMGQTSTKKLSLFADVGYGFGIGGEYFGSSAESSQGDTTKETDRYLNFGRGLKLQAGASYEVLRNLAVAFAFQFSGGVPPAKTVSIARFDVGDIRTTTTTEIRQHYSQFQLALSARPRFTVVDLFDMYVGTGFGIVFTPTHTDASRDIRVANGSTVSNTKHSAKIEYKTKPAAAFLGCLGAELPLTDMLILFGEVNFEAMTVIVKERSVTDDNDITGLAGPGDDLTIIYEQSAPDRPEPPKIPGTNWGLKVGVRIPIL